MTVDVLFLAGILNACLLVAALAFAVFAWWVHLEYRRAILVLLALCAVDLIALQAAFYIDRPGSNLASDYSVYSLAILLGALLGLGVSLKYARRVGLPLAAVLDAAIPVLVIGGIGARSYYVAMHWNYYGEKTADILNLAKGGMGMRGGLILGLVALALFALARRYSFWQLADAGALGLALAESVGWYGAGLIGANYGVVSEARWVPELPDLYGIIQPRIPVQALAALFYFGLFCVLAHMAWRSQPADGVLFLIFLIVSSAAMLSLGFARGDETAVWNGWRIDQWMDLVLVGSGLVVSGVRSMKAPSRSGGRGQAERSEAA